VATLRMTIQMMDKAFDRIWPNLAHDVEDFREPFERMAEVFWERNEQTFADEGPGWTPLTPRYAAWKERHAPGAPLLVLKGHLRESLTSPHGEGSVYEVYPRELVLGSDIEVGTKRKWNLAYLHQKGTRKMVPRPPVPVHAWQEMTTKWSDIMEKWLREEFGYTGL
jgi:hypothetical protein